MKTIIFALITLLGLLPIQADKNDNTLKKNMDKCDFTPKPSTQIGRAGYRRYQPHYRASPARRGSQWYSDNPATQIGRASCRERV